MRTTIWTHPSCPGRHFTQGEYLDFMRVRRHLRMMGRKTQEVETRAREWITETASFHSSWNDLAQATLATQWPMRVLLRQPNVRLVKLEIDEIFTGSPQKKVRIEWETTGFVSWRNSYEKREERDDLLSRYKMREYRPHGPTSVMDYLRLFGFSTVSGQYSDHVGSGTAGITEEQFPSIIIMNRLKAPPNPSWQSIL